MENCRTIAHRAMLVRILELSDSGLDPSRIAGNILDTDRETASFRGRILIEIIISFARQADRETNPSTIHSSANEGSVRAGRGETLDRTLNAGGLEDKKPMLQEEPPVDLFEIVHL